MVEEAAPATKPEAKPEPETVVKAKPVVDSPEEAEARAMLADLTDFFRILIEWDSKRRAKPGRSIPNSRKKE